MNKRNKKTMKFILPLVASFLMMLLNVGCSDDKAGNGQFSMPPMPTVPRMASPMGKLAKIASTESGRR